MYLIKRVKDSISGVSENFWGRSGGDKLSFLKQIQIFQVDKRLGYSRERENRMARELRVKQTRRMSGALLAVFLPC